MAADPVVEAVRALSKCSFLPGSADKRFVSDLLAKHEFNERQRALVLRLVRKYRRQIPTEIIAQLGVVQKAV